MQNYPGDFVAAATFGILSPFLQSLLPSGATWVAHYALELIPLLPSVSAQSDPETSWALPDKATEDSPQHSPNDSKQRSSLPYDLENRRPSIAPSYESSGSQNASPHPTSLSVPMSNEGSNQSTSPLSPRPGSDAGTLDTQDSGDQGPSSTSSLRARGGPNATALVEISNMVMEMREEEVALQITRLAWEMFGGMTVSLSNLSHYFRYRTESIGCCTASRPPTTCPCSSRSSESTSSTSRTGYERDAINRFRQRELPFSKETDLLLTLLSPDTVPRKLDRYPYSRSRQDQATRSNHGEDAPHRSRIA